MNLRTAMMVQRVLSLLLAGLMFLFIFTKNKYVLYAEIVVFLAETAVFFLYNRCPHCGRRFLTFSNRYLIEKRCPYCGGDLDI